ncbi:methyltransferase domain-containing protein [Actinoplanes sp. NPDC026619]|uniref:class I SAM-dependent methyltransferase n=1 Tax=Actinoplanes sp. NPDC026619 TaxID=3155798 RepID=UPI0033F1B4C8
MTTGDNAAAMKSHATYSTAREATAHALRTRWAHLHEIADRQPRICDLGTGDGEFLDQVLARLELNARIEIVEPDEDLAPLAIQRLRAHGHDVSRVQDTGSGLPVDAYLAAHVLFYLPDINGWLTSALARLAPDGVLSVVQRAPTCECNALRKLVRDHHGVAPKVTSDRVRRLAATHGMTTDVVPIASTLSYPTVDPCLAPVPAQSADPELARLICWLAALPTDQRLPDALGREINAFLTDHLVDGTLTLNQYDLLITATRSVGAATQSVEPAATRAQRA